MGFIRGTERVCVWSGVKKNNFGKSGMWVEKGQENLTPDLICKVSSVSKNNIGKVKG